EIGAMIFRQGSDQLSVGSPVGGVYWLMVTLLPTYAYFRYPAKLLPIVSLAVSQLAAAGLDRAVADRSGRLARGLFALGCFSGLAALAILAAGPGLCAQLAQQLVAWCVG